MVGERTTILPPEHIVRTKNHRVILSGRIFFLWTWL